jgi:hypothetical protein
MDILRRFLLNGHWMNRIIRTSCHDLNEFTLQILCDILFGPGLL